jgi:hypothetical protein
MNLYPNLSCSEEKKNGSYRNHQGGGAQPPPVMVRPDAPSGYFQFGEARGVPIAHPLRLS